MARATIVPRAPVAPPRSTLAFNLGGSVASASLITLLDRRTTFHSSVLGAHIALHLPAVAVAVAIGKLVALAEMVARQTTTLAYADTLYGMESIRDERGAAIGLDGEGDSERFRTKRCQALRSPHGASCLRDSSPQR